MPFLRNFQPGVLLDLAGLQGDTGGVKAQALSGPIGNELRGVESSRHSVQGMR